MWEIGMTTGIIMRCSAASFGPVSPDAPRNGNENQSLNSLAAACADCQPPKISLRLGDISSSSNGPANMEASQLLKQCDAHASHCLAFGNRSGLSKSCLPHSAMINAEAEKWVSGCGIPRRQPGIELRCKWRRHNTGAPLPWMRSRMCVTKGPRKLVWRPSQDGYLRFACGRMLQRLLPRERVSLPQLS